MTSEHRMLILLLLATVVSASISYVLSGQAVIGLALLIGLFPVVMSIATRKH